MRTYRKTYFIHENFPVALNEEWSVKERGVVCERWRVVEARKTSFTAEITEYFQVGGFRAGV